ncbi:hypothetical protein [Streptomyces inhibens]|uniref:hypothetical protein n=1 Tax=Streptomyces inhibens TaxID=2293571 RepID=UPI001EE745DC|nr:hypothetical protein [Streptomyces inhibens]UKY50310.1 hypothetical protein KI385_16785 [Streptomyces inhibens]
MSTGRKQLESGHHGIMASGQGFTYLTQVQVVLEAWMGRLDDIGKESGEISELLKATAKSHESNDEAVAQSFSAPAAGIDGGSGQVHTRPAHTAMDPGLIGSDNSATPIRTREEWTADEMQNAKPAAGGVYQDPHEAIRIPSVEGGPGSRQDIGIPSVEGGPGPRQDIGIPSVEGGPRPRPESSIPSVEGGPGPRQDIGIPSVEGGPRPRPESSIPSVEGGPGPRQDIGIPSVEGGPGPHQDISIPSVEGGPDAEGSLGRSISRPNPFG